MSKFYDAIMGLVVGDALGVPFEFRKRDTFRATDMIGHGTYDQPAGTWSDDSSLTLATVESIARKGKIDLHDIMRNFRGWFYDGKFTPHGSVFDVGHTTRSAIERSMDRDDPRECGGYSIRDNGNGSLMRILPLAFCECSIYDIYGVSALTHGHIISETACEIYITIARNLLDGMEIREAIKGAARQLGCVIKQHKEFERISKIDTYSRQEIKSTGYVVDTLEAALWCLTQTRSYKECVLTAVNLGEDTDTVAAVAGGLAGIYYGIGGKSGIPKDWISKIAMKAAIEELCDVFDTKHAIKRKG